MTPATPLRSGDAWACCGAVRGARRLRSDGCRRDRGSVRGHPAGWLIGAMHLLLDTHLVVWAMGSPQRLPTGLAAMLEDPRNIPVFCSGPCWMGAGRSWPSKRVMPWRWPSCHRCIAIRLTGCCWPRPRPTGRCSSWLQPWAEGIGEARARHRDGLHDGCAPLDTHVLVDAGSSGIRGGRDAAPLRANAAGATTRGSDWLQQLQAHARGDPSRGASLTGRPTTNLPPPQRRRHVARRILGSEELSDAGSQGLAVANERTAIRS